MKMHPFLPLAFSIAFLAGCLSFNHLVPPVHVLPDRPWLSKPEVLPESPPSVPASPAASRSVNEPLLRMIGTNHGVAPTKGVFGGYFEPTAIRGLTAQFQGKTNLLGTNWMILTNFPYPMAGGILYLTNAFTNFPALYVRECYIWGK